MQRHCSKDKDLRDFESHMTIACQAEKEKAALEREIDAMDEGFHANRSIDSEARAQKMELLREAHCRERDNRSAAMMIISRDALGRMTTKLAELLDRRSRGDDPDGTLEGNIASHRTYIRRIRDIHSLDARLQELD